MFEGLMEFIESTIFTLINRITDEQDNGKSQTQAIALMLLNFAERNPGMTRVLIGDALVNEDERLQARMNQFAERIELTFRQALRSAAEQGIMQENTVSVRANLLISFILGRWHRFAKSGFKLNPADNAQAQIAILLT